VKRHPFVAPHNAIAGDRSEPRGKVAGRAVDDLQYLRCRGLLHERLVTLGFALGKLTLQIGYGLLAGIDESHARRAPPSAARWVPSSVISRAPTSNVK
jgi:hypothetical protein